MTRLDENRKRWAAAKRKRVQWITQREDWQVDIGMGERRVYRMARFGGWQAKWVASVVMLSGEGRATNAGMRYTLSSGSGFTVDATIYTIGLVDIDEAFLNLLVEDKEKLEWLLKGNEHEFFK